MNFQVDPTELLHQIREGQNPQQIMLSILEANLANTPMGANLLFLARNNRTTEIEQIVRNLAKEQGIDYDKEFTAFRKKLGL